MRTGTLLSAHHPQAPGPCHLPKDDNPNGCAPWKRPLRPPPSIHGWTRGWLPPAGHCENYSCANARSRLAFQCFGCMSDVCLILRGTASLKLGFMVLFPTILLIYFGSQLCQLLIPYHSQSQMWLHRGRSYIIPTAQPQSTSFTYSHTPGSQVFLQMN